MAAGDYLSIEGTPILVRHGQGDPSMQAEEVGAMERAFDGSMRSSVRARKRQWDVTTIWIPLTDAETLRAALEGTPPLEATGAMVGGSATDVYVRGISFSQSRRLMVAGVATNHVTVTFELLEA